MDTDAYIDRDGDPELADDRYEDGGRDDSRIEDEESGQEENGYSALLDEYEEEEEKMERTEV